MASVLGPQPRAPDGVDWDVAVQLLRFHHLVGLAVSLDDQMGRGLLPAAVRGGLEADHRLLGLQGTVALELAERVAGCLTESGVPFVFFKGAELLRAGVYRDPAARTMDDVDVLVPLAHANSAWRAFAEDGLVPWRGWDSERTHRWLDAAAFRDPLLPEGMPRDVDLHWRLGYDAIRFGGDAGESILWDGVTNGSPAPETHWVVLAEHLLKHLRYRIHLPAYADLTRVAAQVTDWPAVQRWMSRSAFERPLAALLGVCRQMGCDIPEQPSRAGHGSRGLERLLHPRSLVGRHAAAHGRLGGLLYRWRLLGTPRAIMRDMVRTGFPERDWLEARYGGEKAAGSWQLWLLYLRDSLAWARGRGNAPTSPDLHGPRP